MFSEKIKVTMPTETLDSQKHAIANKLLKQ